MDDVIKQAALQEFDDVLGLLNVLLSVQNDPVSTQFRLKLLQARHEQEFVKKLQGITGGWRTRRKQVIRRAVHDRQQMLHVLHLDWVNQPLEVLSVRADSHVKRMLQNDVYPQEIHGREINRLRRSYRGPLELKTITNILNV